MSMRYDIEAKKVEYQLEILKVDELMGKGFIAEVLKLYWQGRIRGLEDAAEIVHAAQNSEARDD